MKNAIIVIAICEVIKTIQITLDMVLGMRSRKTLNNAFIDSLKQNNKEWVKTLLEEFDKERFEQDMEFERCEDDKD